jgi:hypothetical protein
MELTADEEQHRERIIGLILTAQTLAEIADARLALQEWVAEHPGDPGITDGFDHLAMSRSIAESREAVSV